MSAYQYHLFNQTKSNEAFNGMKMIGNYPNVPQIWNPPSSQLYNYAVPDSTKLAAWEAVLKYNY